MSPLFIAEIIAVILAVAYLILAARGSLWCWACAFISSAIYSVIFWDVSLLMESLLSIFYIVMAVVGWFSWKKSSESSPEQQEPNATLYIKTLALWQHAIIIFSVLILAFANGLFMQLYTEAVWPFVDAFTTWASVITTFMVVYKFLENWIYWFVIDSISLYLYLDRGLQLTALLFGAYLVIVIFGYISWRKIYTRQGLNQGAN